MRTTSAIKLALPTLALAALVGCGSSSSSKTGTATMSVHLVDAPTTGYTEIDIDVQRVEIHDDVTGAWIRLDDPANPPGTVNLLALQGGVSAELAHGVTIPAGHYTQMRLVLGPDNSCTPDGGTSQPLKVPSGTQSGIKLDVSFDVAPYTTKDVFIDFDADRSIFVHAAGRSGQYLLRPVVRAYDKLATGSIMGVLTSTQKDASGQPVPLADVAVTAQTIDGAGIPTVVRSVRTAADGSYDLDLLPVGGTYEVVVEQPVYDHQLLTPPGVWPASASPQPFPITADQPVVTYSTALEVAPAAGVIGGTITPVAISPTVDEVWIEAPLATGGPTLVVREVAASVAPDASSETFTVGGLPDGSYSVVLARRFMADMGGDIVKTAPAVPAVVSAGTATPIELSAPPDP